MHQPCAYKVMWLLWGSCGAVDLWNKHTCCMKWSGDTDPLQRDLLKASLNCMFIPCLMCKLSPQGVLMMSFYDHGDYSPFHIYAELCFWKVCIFGYVGTWCHNTGIQQHIVQVHQQAKLTCTSLPTYLSIITSIITCLKAFAQMFHCKEINSQEATVGKHFFYFINSYKLEFLYYTLLAPQCTLGVSTILVVCLPQKLVHNLLALTQSYLPFFH